MKKILTLAFIASIGLVACSKDDDDNNNQTEEKSLVGVWVSNEVNAKYIINGATILDSTTSTKAGRWEFTADGKIYMGVNSGEPDPFDIFEDGDTLFYTRSNNMLYIKEEVSEPDDSAVVAEIMTFTTTELSLMASETETDGGITETTEITINFDKQ